jgi:hypothetical protein
VLAYLLARTGAISNWWLIVVLIAVAAVLPLAARRLAPEAVAPGVGVGVGPGGDGDVPLELVGVSRPVTADDRAMLDAALDLPPAGAKR